MRSSLFSLAALASYAFAGVHEEWWKVTWVNDVNPDGLFARRVIGVNNTWPPPPLDVNTTDSLILHVTNDLDQPTSLHHHGMFFNSTTWMDGADGITECGIPPGGKFDYVVPINSSGQWGTYWIHAHAGGQYVDGLRAPVQIHPPKEVFSYDDEFTVVLGDWYHQEHSVLIKQFINTSNPDGIEPIPDSGLIYFNQNGSYLGPIPGTSISSGSKVGFNENATLPFQPGKTYRLRIVNISAFSGFFFWIDGHEMSIIEVDGTDVEASPIDVIGITVAQRYSILVTARNDTSSNWVIHADMDTNMFDVVPPTLNPNITSSITYNTTAPLTNNGTITTFHYVNDTSLIPIPIIPQLPKASKRFIANFNFDLTTDGTNHAFINNVTFNYPLVPSVLSELSLGRNAVIQKAYGPLSVVLDHLEVFDIVIQNADTGAHPFHLHGHKPMIVARSSNFSDPELDVVVEGQANPIRRDVFQIPPGESITLRVVADNPGTWFLHCHIEWHLEVGLAMQFIEAPLQAQQRNKIPQGIIDNCKILGQPTFGNAAGHENPFDLDGLPQGPFIKDSS